MFHHHFSSSRSRARLRTRSVYSQFHKHIPLTCTPSNEEPLSFEVSDVEHTPQGIDYTNPIQVFLFLCLFSIWFGGFSRRKMEMVIRYVSNKIE